MSVYIVATIAVEHWTEYDKIRDGFLVGAWPFTRGRDAQWRPCKLDAARLREVSDWVERYRAFRQRRLDRLDGYRRELESSPSAKPRRKKRHKA